MKNWRWALTAWIILFIAGHVSAEKGNSDHSGKSSKAEFVFEDINVLPNTSVKNQARSNTCWAFSALSFLESELLRLGREEVDLSEMFVVWHTYTEKAMRSVRLHGQVNFSAGGAFHDVTDMISRYGIVPESVYDGLGYGVANHSHGEMDRVLKSYMEGVLVKDDAADTGIWEETFESTLNTYLGKTPNLFEYKGNQYTPQSFARDYVGLNMDDYVEISSFTHHPFYSRFILEVPDNWSWGEVYNVPVKEMEEIINFSLKKGISVAWASDISEKGFSTSKFGVAVVNDQSLNEEFQTTEEGTLESPEGFTETEISQQMRQEAFEKSETTDDHGMHIVGLANDQQGNEYYKVKNSWGDYNKFDGFFYASKAYVDYKTTCIMVHKDGIPQQIREKLGL